MDTSKKEVINQNYKLMVGGNNSHFSPDFIGRNSAVFTNRSRCLSLESHLKSSSG